MLVSLYSSKMPVAARAWICLLGRVLRFEVKSMYTDLQVVAGHEYFVLSPGIFFSFDLLYMLRTPERVPGRYALFLLIAQNRTFADSACCKV